MEDVAVFDFNKIRIAFAGRHREMVNMRSESHLFTSNTSC